MNETCSTAKRTSRSLSNPRVGHTPDLHETKYFLKQIHLPSVDNNWIFLTNKGKTIILFYQIPVQVSLVQQI